jgi:hypothetical protein
MEGLITHAPLRLERARHGRLSKDLVAREPADAPCAAANSVGVCGGETATVAPDRARLATGVGVGEFAGRGEVESGEGA